MVFTLKSSLPVKSAKGEKLREVVASAPVSPAGGISFRAPVSDRVHAADVEVHIPALVRLKLNDPSEFGVAVKLAPSLGLSAAILITFGATGVRFSGGNCPLAAGT